MLCQSSKQTTSSLNNQSINIVHFTSQLHVLHAMMQCKGGKTATSIIAISTIVVSSSISSKEPASDSVNQLQIRRCQLFRALNWTYFLSYRKTIERKKSKKLSFLHLCVLHLNFYPPSLVYFLTRKPFSHPPSLRETWARFPLSSGIRERTGRYLIYDTL